MGHDSTAETFAVLKLYIYIKPVESIRTRFLAQYPVPDMRLNPVEMLFCYEDTFEVSLPDACETLLLDTIEGNDGELAPAISLSGEVRI